MIAVIDYGVGNLFSLRASLRHIGAESTVTADPDEIRSADRIILPGVGAFGDSYCKLEKTGLVQVIKEEASRGKPMLGICLGMQLLFSESLEYGVHKGLGLIDGRVVPMADELPGGLKVPHMGWNNLKILKKSGIFKYISDGDSVYYVHSFYAKCDPKYISAVSEYGIDITGAVERENIFGTQFHPEKSGETGLDILRAFSEI